MSACTSPVRIKNPKKSYSHNVDKYFLDVPCNCCPNCRATKQLSWVTRMYFEWQHTLKCGGASYYYTLTYNNEHLPKKYGIPVFSKRDCQLFFKRLRRNLERKGYRTDFKYFLVSEYGSEKKRPHYHFILFYKQKLPIYLLEREIRHSWCVENDWHQFMGNVKPGELGATVESIKALNYVTKYVMKDMLYENAMQEISKLYDFLECPIFEEDVDEDKYKAKKDSDLKQFKQFYLPSHHLGECILTEMETRKSSIEASRLIMPDTNIDGQYVDVPVPMYIKRKLYYNESCPIKGKIYRNGKWTYSTTYVLNDKGIKAKVNTLDRTIEEQSQKYYSYLSYFDTPETFQLLGCSVHDASLQVMTLLNGRSFSDLAVYNLVYRGRYDSGLTDYKTDYARFLDPLPINELRAKHTMYNSREEFEGFDEVLTILDQFVKLESYVRTNKRIDKYNSKQVVLSQMQPSKYRTARFIPNIPLKSF